MAFSFGFQNLFYGSAFRLFSSRIVLRGIDQSVGHSETAKGLEQSVLCDHGCDDIRNS